MTERRFVCERPCHYRLGDRMPWPPELPGIDNWARGDVATLLAYVEAIGNRVLSLEENVKELATKVQGLREDMQDVCEKRLPEVEVLGERVENVVSAIRELDVRTVGSLTIGRRL